MWDLGLGASALSAAASLGGGIMSASGAASANAQNIANQNMINQQMMNAQIASHAQNTAFQEDAQNFTAKSQSDQNVFNSIEAEKNRAFQSNEAQTQMNFQRDMSSTAYQRAMADMKAAGLNPMLAYQQGGSPMGQGAAGSGSAASGSSSSGATASAQGPPSLRAATVLNDKSELGRAISNMVSSAVDTQKTISGINLMKEQEHLATQKKHESKAAENNLTIDSIKKYEESKRIGAETENVDADTENKRTSNALIKAQTTSAAQYSRLSEEEIKLLERYGSKQAPGWLERLLRDIQTKGEKSNDNRSMNDRARDIILKPMRRE